MPVSGSVTMLSCAIHLLGAGSADTHAHDVCVRFLSVSRCNADAQLTFRVILFCRLCTKLLAELQDLLLSLTPIENDNRPILVCSHVCFKGQPLLHNEGAVSAV